MVDHRSILRDHLHQSTKIGLEEIALDRVKGTIDPLRAGGAAYADITEQRANLLRGDNGDHVRCHTLHRTRVRVGFRRHHSRSETVMEVGVEVSGCFRGRAVVIGRPRIGGAADGGKTLAVDITPHAERTSFPGDGEIEFAVGTAAVRADEVEAALRCRQPGGIPFSGVVERAEGPCRAALEPDGLVGVDQGSVLVETGEQAAVHAVQPMAQPERNDAPAQAIVIGCAQLGETCGCQTHGVYCRERTVGVRMPGAISPLGTTNRSRHRHMGEVTRGGGPPCVAEISAQVSVVKL